MFAISISDERKKCHCLIRDRFGIKPLYYHLNNKTKEVTFCSEVQGIFLNNIPKKENLNEIKRYLNYDLLACNNQTWFQDIFQLQPSHFLEVSKNNLRIKKYYKIEDHIDETEDADKSTLKNEQKNYLKLLSFHSNNTQSMM